MYDDNGRICSRCNEYKTWENYHAQNAPSAINGKRAACKQCRKGEHKPSLKHRERTNDLYMLESNGYYKIGVTNNVDGRIAKLQQGNPHPITLVKLWPGRGDLEYQVHSMLAPFHVRGEWFKPNWG